ncbi:MAG: hypothetical protein QY323_01240 [Patescibacteria group bacterium]|nr:MAG: hypothetical protein QY323_01240 [Patescibacteria group bacterium]
MHILDFTPEEIAAALKNEEKAKKSLDDKLARVAEQMSKLAKKQAELKKEVAASEWRLNHLDVSQALHVLIPEELWSLRAALAKKRIEARETDSKRESASLHAEAAQMEKELLAKCPHPLVVNAAGYQATNHNDDDDRSEPGERFCAVCNHHEVEYARWSGQEAGFKKLVEAENRVWAREHREAIEDLRKTFLKIDDYRELLNHFTPQRALELLESLRKTPTK